MADVVRLDPPFEAAERPMLEAWLDFHRATLATKCAGLDDEQLRLRAVPPSTLTLLGLVRHLADVERYWFQWVFAGESVPPYYWTDEDPDADFNGVEEADSAEAFATWRAACERSRTITQESADLAVTGVNLRDGRPVSLRWILVHLVEEYARHNGHADLLRERVDGVTGE